MLQLWFDSFTTAAFARDETFDLTPWVVSQKNPSGYPDFSSPNSDSGFYSENFDHWSLLSKRSVGKLNISLEETRD